jgi:hypothetical protein
MPLAEAAAFYGLKPGTLAYRLGRKWPAERLFEPSMTYLTAGHAIGSSFSEKKVRS